MKQFGLYLLLVRLYLRRLSEYRADLLIGAIPMAGVAALGVVFLHVALGAVYAPVGWTQHQATIVYGLATISIGLARTLFKETMSVIRLVRTGDLAGLLITPVNPLLMVLSGSLGLEFIGQTVLGIGLVIYGMCGASVPPSASNLAAAVLAVVSGTVIVASVDLISTSLALYSEGSIVLINITRTIMEFGRYPASLFGGALTFMLTAIFPIAFGGYYAGVFMCQDQASPLAWLSPAVAMVLAGLAYLIWAQGLKRFQGTGS